MNTTKRLVIETEAPDDYMVEIMRRVRHSISQGKYEGEGRINRVDMVVFEYSYIYSV